MPNPILPRRSFTPLAVPSVSTDISAPGELVINWADKVAYTKNAAGTLITVPLGGGGGSGSLSGSVTIPGMGDPYYSNVSLLLNFDGNLTDRSANPKTITAVGNAAATGSAKFGSASLALDGNGDGLRVDGFPTGTQDFTIEFWVQKASSWTSETSHRHLFDFADSDSGLSGGLQVYWNYAINALRMSRFGVDVVLDYSVSSLMANTWYHFAYVRSGTTITLYRDGVSVASVSGFSGSFGNPSSGIQAIGIGSYQGSYQASSSWPGLIDDVRITRGVARAITVPTSAYSTDLTLPVTITGTGGGGSGLTWSTVPASPTATGTAGQIAYDANYIYIATGSNQWTRAAVAGWGDAEFANVALLLHGDGTLVDSSSYGRIVTAYGGANAGGTPKFGAGSLNFPLNGDYFSVPDSESLELGNSNFTLEAWVYPTAYPVSNNGYYQSAILGKLVGGDHSWAWNLSGTSSSFTEMVLQVTDQSAPTQATAFSVSASFAINTWTHVAVVRSGSMLYFFKDGTLLNAGGTAFNVNIRNGTSPIYIGRQQYDSTYIYQFFGLMDEIRVTKAARYTAPFTAPTAAFPDQ